MEHILGFLVAALAMILGAPYVIKLSEHWGFIDQPGGRKRHRVPTPTAGGMALYPFILVAILNAFHATRTSLLLSIAVTIILLIGLYDDKRALHFGFRFATQILASILVILAGFQIHLIDLRPFAPIHLTGEGLLSYLMTLVWIVGLTNAVNLVDGLDGLASGLSFNALVGMCAIATLGGKSQVGMFACLLAGALYGFLRFNFPRARSFLGDSGSTLLGFSIALVSIVMSAKQQTFLILMVPALFLAIPMVDTLLAFFRRIFSGAHPFKPDRGHLHHRLLDLNFTPTQILSNFLVFSAVLGVIGFWYSEHRNVDALLWSLIIIAFMLGSIKALNVFNFHDRIIRFNLRLKKLARDDVLVFNRNLLIKVVLTSVITLTLFNTLLGVLFIDTGRELFLAATGLLLLLALPDVLRFTRNGNGRIMPHSKAAIFFLILNLSIALGVNAPQGILYLKPFTISILLLVLGSLILYFSPVRIVEVLQIDPLDIVNLYLAVFICTAVKHFMPTVPTSVLAVALINSVILFGTFRLIFRAAVRTSPINQPILAMPVLFAYFLMWTV